MIAFPEEMKKKHIWLIFFPIQFIFSLFLWQQSEKYPYSDSINIINPHGSISSKNNMIYVEELVILKKEEISRRSINTHIDI